MPDDNIETRLKKTHELRRIGLNPYPHNFEPSHRVPELVDSKQLELDVKVAGRIMSFRGMGKVTFLDMADRWEKIQLFLKSEYMGENYELVQYLDLGDFIGVEGTTFNTRTGEYSINVRQMEILAKAMRPLPDKRHGIKDPELRYSQRTLDLIANPEVAGNFIKRAKAITTMREFLDSAGFLEVEVPLIQPVYGGASAAPFLTHVNALDRDYFLSISPELYLKRLIAGGFDAVYTITKNFRNEGIDRSHNPEFTMMECYRAYMDYNGMMRLTEEMIASIATRVNGSLKLEYRGQALNFQPPWQRLPLVDAVETAMGIRLDKMTEGQLKDFLAKKPDIKIGDYEVMTKGEIVQALFEGYAADNLIGPVFIIDHPIESTPLCKPHRSNPGLIERFEPYVAGMEIGNAYTELNDPVLQRRLLEEQVARERVGNPYIRIDENFLRALEHGMPPTGGLGIGIDRVVMILTNQPTIKEVILFPFTKAEPK